MKQAVFLIPMIYQCLLESVLEDMLGLLRLVIHICVHTEERILQGPWHNDQKRKHKLCLLLAEQLQSDLSREQEMIRETAHLHAKNRPYICVLEDVLCLSTYIYTLPLHHCDQCSQVALGLAAEPVITLSAAHQSSTVQEGFPPLPRIPPPPLDWCAKRP